MWKGVNPSPIKIPNSNRACLAIRYWCSRGFSQHRGIAHLDRVTHKDDRTVAFILGDGRYSASSALWYKHACYMKPPQQEHHFS